MPSLNPLSPLKRRSVPASGSTSWPSSPDWPRTDPRRVSWLAVAGAAALALTLLLVGTVYLPARQAAAQGNVVHVQDLTLTLTAQRDSAYEHGVDLDVTVEPAPDDDAAVQMAVTMPTMGNMQAASSSLSRVGLGRYRGVAELGMGGLWRVEISVLRPGKPAGVGAFRLNA